MTPPLAVLLLLSSSLFSPCFASRIPLGSKISAAHPSHWLSPRRDFAFGFSNHSDLPSRYVLGVRFNSRDDHPRLVWLAGAGVSVGQDSQFHLTTGGDMLLLDGARRSIAWSSNTTHLSVACAALLDDGNLVLLNARGVVVWQSFSTPFDTLLPGQNLTSSQLLRASSSNLIASYYSLRVDSSGQPMLTWESNVSYWKAGATVNSPPLSSLRFTNAGALELFDQTTSTVVWSAFADDHGDPLVRFRYLRLDADGNLRMYSLSENSRSWKVVWQAVQNQCEVFATCGLRGVCVFNVTGLTDCTCPFRTASDSSNNCLAPYKQRCSSGTTMVVLPRTFLYGIYPPHDVVANVGAQGCRRLCLEDPLCTSASTSNDGSGHCWLKRTQFVSGVQHPSLVSVSFVKECLDPLAVLPLSSAPSISPDRDQTSRSLWHPYYLVGMVFGTILVLVIAQIITGLWLLGRRKDSAEGIGSLMLNSIGIVSLPYAELHKLTDGFGEPLGLNAHKGLLPTDQVIVVKDLKDLAHVEERHFRCWVSLLGSIYHKNLVKVVAYSYSAEHRFVVYPFLKNGSVDRWLEEARLAKRLGWSKRMDICLGVARAITYLHSGCRQFVGHGNLKWKNVLLDEQFEAKLSEFGFGKFFKGASQHGSLAEDDVCRFGEMLVVMVTGKRGGPQVCLWAYKEWEARHVDMIIDSRMAGKADFGDAERVLRLAFWCVQDDVRSRPSMSEVTKVLEGSLPVDPPPLPYQKPELLAVDTCQIEEMC